MVDPLSARDLVKRLGTFLADLTMDRAPARIHADILERLRQTTTDPDRQLTGVYLEEKDFSSVWTAIRNGASMPVSSWDTVILPVIACYSSDEALKGNLQLAIHLWGQARTALSTVDDPARSAIVPVYEVIPEDTIETLDLPGSPGIAAEPPIVRRPARSGISRRVLIGLAASLTLIALIVAIVVIGEEPSGGLKSALPSMQPSRHVTSPIEPSLSPIPSPTDLAEPPMPTAAGSGMMPPTAPRALAMISKTQTTVTLTWLIPNQAGHGGLSHYRLFRDSSDAGWTKGYEHTVTGLSPNTAYVFVVRAYNGAGRESPPSNALVVTTDPVPPPALKVWTNPPTPIAFGSEFDVIGSGWPCTSPAQVEIYLRGSLIATPTTDSNGSFNVHIEVYTDPEGTKVAVLNPSGYLLLESGAPEDLKVTLPSQPQCAATGPKTITVVFS